MTEDAPIILAAGAAAFGDGNHPTTRMVLAALGALDPESFTPRTMCDMGCGSGLLALRAVQLFGCHVVAADLERQAVEATRENAAHNGMQDHITAVHSDGFRHETIAAHAPYDLMVMNILAEPLLRLAPDAARLCAPEGLLILSGILHTQQSHIREVYETLGFTLLHHLQQGDWVCLLFENHPDPS